MATAVERGKQYEVNLHELLGEGTYGKVYRVTYENRPAAMKVFKCSSDRKEIHLLKKLDHPNIIKAVSGGLLFNRAFSCFCMELMPMTLEHKITVVTYTPESIQRTFRQLLEAVAYLQRRNLVHGDIGSRNILCTAAPPHKDVPKLCDFGVAGMRYGKPTPSILCPDSYLSPDAFAKVEGSHRELDMWSLAVTVLECIHRRNLFSPTKGSASGDTLSIDGRSTFNLSAMVTFLGPLPGELATTFSKLGIPHPEEQSKLPLLPHFSEEIERRNQLEDLLRSVLVFERRPVARKTLQHEYFKPLPFRLFGKKGR